MKPFNLEEYLANPSKKIVTKEGKPARIICTDRRDLYFPIVALVAKNQKRKRLLDITQRMENFIRHFPVVLTSFLPLKSTKVGLMCINQEMVGF